MVSPLLSLFEGCPAKGDDQRGFTLIELIVVTALIGIMLSLSVPSMRTNFFTDPLKTTARKTIGLVTGVRELAVRTQQPYLLYINRLENRIWYEQETAGKKTLDKVKEKEAELILPKAVRISGILVGKDNASSENQFVIWISRQGYMDDTVLRLEDDKGNRLNVQFFPFLDPAIVSDQEVSF